MQVHPSYLGIYVYSFENLEVWQEAKILTRKVYTLTSQFPDTEKYGFLSQLRRASISICSNLAEGTSRKSRKCKAYFTAIARELNLINHHNYQECRAQIDAIASKLNALKRSQIRTPDNK